MKVLNRSHKESGIGLIEVLIVLVVLVIGWAAIAALQGKLISGSSASKARNEALGLAREKTEELKNSIEKGRYVIDLAAGIAILDTDNNPIAGTYGTFTRKWDLVAVSLDGATADVHDGIRGVEGSHAKAVQAVKFLVETGTPTQIIMTIMNENAGQINNMIRLAEELKASSLKFNIVQPIARGSNLHKHNATLGLKELIQLGKKIDAEQNQSTKLKLMINLPMAFLPLSRLAQDGGCGICGIFGIIGLLPSGHYALCGIGEHLPDLVFGQAGKDALAKVWQENPTLQKLRQGLPDQLEGICARCLMKQRCLAACIAENYYLTKQLFGPHWFCKDAEKEGLFPTSRLTNLDT